MSKKVDARITHKHDFEANWQLAKNFIPHEGELIIYDSEVNPDGNSIPYDNQHYWYQKAGRTEPYKSARFKVGDGKTYVNDLPFSSALTDAEFADAVNKVASLLPITGKINYSLTPYLRIGYLPDEEGNTQLTYDYDNKYSAATERPIYVPKDTRITLRLFNHPGWGTPTPYILTVLYSYDNTENYNEVLIDQSNPTFVTEQDARILLSISAPGYTEDGDGEGAEYDYPYVDGTLLADPRENLIILDVYTISAHLSILDENLAVVREHIANEENPHRVEVAKLVDGDNVVLKNKTYIVNDTDDVATIIKNAQPYSTIKLSPGDYGLIQLKGVSSFPEGLTITCDPKSSGANPDVKVAGIDISSTITNGDTWLTDLTPCKLNGNLTIRYITFTDSVCVRNCIIDGVTIRDCAVTNGSISIAPNRFDSKHHSLSSDQRSIKWSHQTTTAKNISIRKCTISSFDNVYGPPSGSKYKYGIFVECCEDIYIYENTLNDGGTNGIFVCGIDSRARAGGRVSISKNTVKKSTGAGIYVKALYDANVHITSNVLHDGQTTSGQAILVANCVNTLTKMYRRHTSSSNTGDGYNTYKNTTDGSSTSMKPNSGLYLVSDSTSYITNSTYDDHVTAFNSHKTAFENHKTEFNSHKTAFNEHKTAFENHKKELADHITQANANLTEHINNTTDFHGLNLEDIVWKSKTITITPEDVPDSESFSEIVKNAQEGTIIQLTAGNYPKLNLNGKSSFRKNITIRGHRTRDHGSEDVLANYEKHTHVAGVAISSNIKPYIDLEDPMNMHSDISGATLSDNIRFEHLILDDPFSLVNAEITGLTIYDCQFNEGAYAQICPNQTNNYFNDYDSFDGTYEHFPIHLTRYAHNVVIRNCHFIDARKSLSEEAGSFNPEDGVSAIYLKTVDGATITGNKIDRAAYNGIQITGTNTLNRFKAKSKGRFVITSNTIKETGSRSIRMSSIENAEIILLWNLMSYKNNIATQKDVEAVKISCDLTSTVQTKYKHISSTIETNTYTEFDESAGKEVTTKLSQVFTEKTAGIFVDQSKTYNSVITDLQNQINSLQTQLNNLIVASTTFDPEDVSTWPKNATFVVKYDDPVEED